MAMGTLTVVIIFLMSVIIFHLLAWLNRNRLTKRFYKGGEYLFIFVAIISLVGAFAALRASSLQPQIVQVQKAIWDSYSPYGANLGLTDDWVYDTALRLQGRYDALRIEIPDPEFDPDIEAIETNPHLTPSLVRKMKFRYFFNEVKFDALKDSGERILARGDLRSEHKRLVAHAQPASYEQVLIFLAPFLGVIAVSLKATITTVELSKWYM